MTTMSTAHTKATAWVHLDHKTRILELKELVAKGAVTEYQDILAGNIDVGIAESERLAIATKLPPEALKQILLLTRVRNVAETLVTSLKDEADLIALSLFAKSVHTRKNAALSIDDKFLLEELREQVRDNDKTVFKTVDQRLNNLEANIKERSSQEPAKSNSENSSGFKAVAEDKTTSTTEENFLRVQNTFKSELPHLEKQLSKLSFKNTAGLKAARNTLLRLLKVVDKPVKESDKQVLALHEVIKEKFEKNRIHQEHLREKTLTLLQSLKLSLDKGQSHEALPTWDKIQGNINNTSGKTRKALQSEAKKFKNKLNEMRDWKNFAVTEKKKELIKHMQLLVESHMHAADRSRRITGMHKKWKLLGLSSQNEGLWKEFKQFSDKAYEPCKTYFKERKQLMTANLQKRREICKQLEKYLAEIDKQSVNLPELNKLFVSTENDWKRYAPVEQPKIKSLQKRYYGVVNQLRRIRKISLRENNSSKLELIEQVKKLVTIDDNRKAMREAKELQQSWKKIGPTSYKDDKKLWESFRSACDEIFAIRNQATIALKEELEKTDKILDKILESSDALLKLEDDAFRTTRSEFQDLTQQFSDSLSPEVRKRRKKLITRFNELKKKIETRYKKLPNKKYQQLKDSIVAKTQFLECLERKLLSSKDTNQFTETKSSIDKNTWKSLVINGNPEHELALESRLQQLLNAKTPEALLGLTHEAEHQIRSLCIELEIRANIETPKEEQAARMKIQLDQLKNTFGKSKPDHKENVGYAMDAELRSFCIGPLKDIARKQFSRRLARAINKLL